MCKGPVPIFFFWFILCPLVLLSQDGFSVKDTVIQTQPVNSEDSLSFKTVTKGELIAVRTVPQDRLDSFRKADDFWYANTVPERKKESAESNPRRERTLMDKGWFRDLLWVIILSGFLAVVLWYLYSSNILVFRKAPKKINDEVNEEPTEDIFGLNYEKEIAKAVAAHDFRLAVRLWYLRTLKDLADSGLIDYRYGRTNSDYVSQLRNTTHHRDFTRLTRAFEYTWYGQFALPAEAFALMQNEFVNFKKALDR